MASTVTAPAAAQSCPAGWWKQRLKQQVELRPIEVLEQAAARRDATAPQGCSRQARAAIEHRKRECAILRSIGQLQTAGEVTRLVRLCEQSARHACNVLLGGDAQVDASARQECLRRHVRPGTSSTDDRDNPLSDAAFISQELTRAADGGGFWLATFAGLFPEAMQPGDAAAGRFVSALARRLEQERGSGPCKATAQAIRGVMRDARAGAVGWAPVNHGPPDAGGRAPRACLDQALADAVTMAKAGGAGGAREGSATLRERIAQSVSQHHFLTIAGGAGDAFTVYWNGRGGANGRGARGAAHTAGERITIDGQTITVAAVPRSTRITIQRKPRDPAAPPSTWVRFASDDLFLWGMPELGCLDLDVVEPKGTGITRWLDGTLVEGRRVLVDQGDHDLRILDGDGMLLAQAFIKADEIKPAGPCHSVRFDLTTRDRTLRLQTIVEDRCAASDVDSAAVTDVVKRSSDAILESQGKKPTFDYGELTRTVQGVGVLQDQLLGLGQDFGPSRGELDGVGLVKRAAAEGLRQGFEAVLSTELQCSKTGQDTVYLFTANHVDLERVRKQTRVTAGIDVMAATHRYSVSVRRDGNFAHAVHANLARVMGSTSVRYENAAPATLYDDEQEHKVVVTRGRDVPVRSKLQLLAAVARTGDHTCIEKTEAFSVEESGSAVDGQSSPELEEGGGLDGALKSLGGEGAPAVRSRFDITGAADTENRFSFVVPPFALEPGRYVAVAGIAMCVDTKCREQRLVSVVSRCVEIVNRTMVPWGRLAMGGHSGRAFPEFGLFVQAGVDNLNRSKRAFGWGPFVGYGLRYVGRDSPPTWDPLVAPERATVDYGNRGETPFHWFRHSAAAGMNFSWMRELVPRINMELVVAPFIDLAFVTPPDVPASYTDVLGSRTSGATFFDPDASILVGGGFTAYGWKLGVGLMIANVFDLGQRFYDYFNDDRHGFGVQSVEDGANLILFLNAGFGGPR
jgi:hypothetical protein